MTAYAYLPAGYDDAPLNTEALPVIEVLDGFPGTPLTWLRRMQLQQRLDTEIAAHRMPPAVVILPYQTPDLRHDTECVDASGGMAADTFLTRDVPAAVAQRFRVRTDAAAWGLIGYSTGGFCSVNLALRHPDRYAAAVSLSGYFSAVTDRTTGDLYHGDAFDRELNSPLWRLEHLPVPPMGIYLASARDDPNVYRQMRRFAAEAKPPLQLTTATTPLGGHTIAAWLPMIAPALDWLGSWLAGPIPVAGRTAPATRSWRCDRGQVLGCGHADGTGQPHRQFHRHPVGGIARRRFRVRRRGGRAPAGRDPGEPGPARPGAAPFAEEMILFDADSVAKSR